MSTLRIAVIPGDGIGAEVIPEALRVLHALAAEVGQPITLTPLDLGADRTLRGGGTLPDDVFASIRDEHDAILLGALGDPRIPDHSHARDILLGLRTRLELYVNLRPSPCLHPRLNALAHAQPGRLTIVRENTEGPYAGIGGQLRRGTPDEVAIEADMNTYRGVDRLVRWAFGFATRRGYTRVTLADKANAMRHGHDLWQRVFTDTAADHPHITADHRYVDALAHDLVRDPSGFEVIVAPNLLGDILSDLAAGLTGGLGLAASANLHPGAHGLFESVHGSAPSLVGTQRANPIAAILSAGLLLANAGHHAVMPRLHRAVHDCVDAGEVTPDLGGTLRTKEATEAILRRIER